MIYDIMEGTVADFHYIIALLHKTADILDIKPDGVYAGAMLSRAGHSEHLLSKPGTTGRLYMFDQDQTAIDNAQIRLRDYIEKGQIIFIKGDFRGLVSNLALHSVTEIDGTLYDLEVSSPQLDEREHGFSYKKDAPLGMHMNRDQDLLAYNVVSTYDYHDLVRIFFKYGGDKFSEQTAHKVKQARKVKPVETTTELAKIIKSVRPAKKLKRKGHPTKQISQVVRIEVDDELDTTDESIQQATELLAVDGRISAVIFRSLEDRLTKQLFKEASTVDVSKGLSFIPENMRPKFALVNRKLILPSEEGLEVNNRPHSARLHAVEKVRK